MGSFARTARRARARPSSTVCTRSEKMGDCPLHARQTSRLLGRLQALEDRGHSVVEVLAIVKGIDADHAAGVSTVRVR